MHLSSTTFYDINLDLTQNFLFQFNVVIIGMVNGIYLSSPSSLNLYDPKTLEMERRIVYSIRLL
jgi:hypothetical protein